MNLLDTAPALELVSTSPRPGMRLAAVEVLNWGTFDKRVWRLDLNCDNALLTGDIGSGKSTFVDAITTLLVPAQRIAYNKAAGAEARERDLRSYVLGYYKSERGEAGLSAKPVALRDHNSYSVILGRFRNDGFGEDVTLAQVFYFREREGQPVRFYVVASGVLSIAKHFAAAKEIGALKKRLRRMPQAEVFDSFPPYGAAFRRLFGIQNEQALDLFHQTVSMKSVGDLTDFVRNHMLEAFPVEKRIDAMIAHFADLTSAHAAVLKAKDQIARLTPLVADCESHAAVAAEAERLRESREALPGYFASLKFALLQKRLAALAAELARLDARAAAAKARRDEEQRRRDAVKQAIAENGGDRIEAVSREIAAKEKVKSERLSRSQRYEIAAAGIGLKAPKDAEDYLFNCKAIEEIIDRADAEREELDNALTEEKIAFRQLKDEHGALSSEIASLKKRRSNLPARMLELRENLCADLGVKEATLPFAGELIEVRKEERGWEGAAERVLHNFAVSLLVPDEIYAKVAQWADGTHLGKRLVYYRVRRGRPSVVADLHPRSLVHKLAIKPDSPFYGWLDAQLGQRFDYACCANLDDFRREERALTRSGQIKARGERHEKDDRHRIDDRTRYVLGWSNEAKIASLAAAAASLEERIKGLAGKIQRVEEDRKTLQRRLDAAQQLNSYGSFEELDWMSAATEIERFESERRAIEEGSDTLRTLRVQLVAIEAALAQAESKSEGIMQERGSVEAKREAASKLLEELSWVLGEIPEAARQPWIRLDAVRGEALGEHKLTIESCDGHERTLRQWLQSQIDSTDKRAMRLREAIVKAMQAYRTAYPAETREVDAAVEAGPDYKAMLDTLVLDGLPQFEARFKALLNENTIREIAGFQSQLYKERQVIRERIELINSSLRDIDYNPGRYIELLAEQSSDQDVRQFQQDLRACTEGALTGSDDADYSEAKFLEVKRIIERLKGREGTADLDKRWTRKVTDVRNWFSFSASERWREDGREHEHYTDSGGKSGGQKEKLAYTILAASVAYQFGLDLASPRSKSFHFVMIDEAFGRGSDESAAYGLKLFKEMNLQLLVATPLQKIHVIDPFVAAVGFVHNEGGRCSMLRNLTIEEYREEQRIRRAG